MNQTSAYHTMIVDLMTAATPAVSLQSTIALVCLVRSLKASTRPFLLQLGKQVLAPDPKAQKKDEERIEWFATYAFRLAVRCYVMALSVMEYYESPDHWHDTTLLWRGYPHHNASKLVEQIYLLQLAYHLDDMLAIFYDVFWNQTARKDFVETTVHHAATVGLLAGSYYYKFTRIGTVVSTLHCLADLPKDAAKVALQAGWKKLARALFAILVVTWGVTRLYIYPVQFLRSVFVESYLLWEHPEANVPKSSARTLQGLLVLILILNTAWFGLLLKILVKAINGTDEDPYSKKVQVGKKANGETVKSD